MINNFIYNRTHNAKSQKDNNTYKIIIRNQKIFSIPINKLFVLSVLKYSFIKSFLLNSKNILLISSSYLLLQIILSKYQKILIQFSFNVAYNHQMIHHIHINIIKILLLNQLINL